MTKKFIPKIYQGKDRIYESIKSAPRVSRLWIWDHERGEYSVPKTGKIFCASRYEPDGNGDKTRKKQFFDSLSEARRWQGAITDQKNVLIPDAVRKQLSHRSLQFGEGYTVVDLIQDWQKLGWSDRREGTRIFYGKVVRMFEFLYNVEVEKLSPKLIDAWIFHLKSEPMVKTYRKSRLSFTKEIYGFQSMLRWYVEINDDTKLIWPFKKRHQEMLKLRDRTNKKARSMQQPEFDLWIETLKSTNPKFQWMAIVQTRQLMRVSEVCAMRWSNLDLKNRTYRLCEYVFWPRVGGAEPRLLQGTKNMISGEHCDIPLRDDTIEVLSKIPRLPGCDLIFHDHGELVRYRQVQHAYNRAFEIAGLPYTSTHVCRHTGSTNFLQETGDILALKQMGNWSDLKSALHYGQIMKTRAKEAIEKADQKVKLALVENE